MVDYSFYHQDYLGSIIPETAFSGTAARAQGYLDRFKRVYRVETSGQQAENMALCAMAETLYESEKHSGISGASLGSVSVRYQDGEGRALVYRLYEQASIYLDIYRGVGV